MNKILCITASPRGEFSLSCQLTHKLARGLAERYKDAVVTTRDLAQQAPPHWGAAQVRATFLPPEARTATDHAALALSNELCQELAEARVLVVGSPVWNFSVTSSLKAWVDHIVRPGVTFRYVATGGVEGLLTNLERVVIVEVSGGNYEDELMPAAGQYLQKVFRFLGVREVNAISARGAAIDEAAALSTGELAVARFFAQLPTQARQDLA